MGSIFMRFPGGKSKALTLSYDDGVEQDIRLIDIMKRNGLKGTFNINSGSYGMDYTKVYNPTCTTLYFKTAKGEYQVKPGETVSYEF